MLGGALILMSKGKTSCELGHTNQATYFIARDTKKHGVYHAQGSRWGKRSSISQVSVNICNGRKSIIGEPDEWGRMTHGTIIALRFKICVKHGISNSLRH